MTAMKEKMEERNTDTRPVLIQKTCLKKAQVHDGGGGV